MIILRFCNEKDISIMTTGRMKAIAATALIAMSLLAASGAEAKQT